MYGGRSIITIGADLDTVTWVVVPTSFNMVTHAATAGSVQAHNSLKASGHVGIAPQSISPPLDDQVKNDKISFLSQGKPCAIYFSKWLHRPFLLGIYRKHGHYPPFHINLHNMVPWPSRS